MLGSKAAPVQDYVVFTYDDYQSGQANGPYVPPPQHIVSIRETRWKLARVLRHRGHGPSRSGRCTTCKTDPLETINLARPGYRRTSAENAQYARLRRRLAEVQATRLQPL